MRTILLFFSGLVAPLLWIEQKGTDVVLPWSGGNMRLYLLQETGQGNVEEPFCIGYAGEQVQMAPAGGIDVGGIGRPGKMRGVELFDDPDEQPSCQDGLEGVSIGDV